MSQPVRPLGVLIAIAVPFTFAAIGLAGIRQQAVIDQYVALAKAKDPAFAGFSAARGKAFFLARRAGGNPETASCSSCHTSDPTKPGQTRAGQAIDPMAVSANADRFTDFAKDEKWFKRNCSTVLQRECTPVEKGDFISFMVDQ